MTQARMTIPVARPVLNGNERKYLTECIDSGWISSRGRFIEAFETAFAGHVGTKHALTASNGTTALHLALLGLGIKPGDEVIVPALTFSASAATVVHAGARPVFVDVRADNYNMDEALIEKKISQRTKAIMVVHLYGYPADMDKVVALAKKHNLKIIEDCAESPLTRYKGKPVGSLGEVGCFSFFGNKIITTGEGGMCTTNDPAVHHTMDLYKNHGMSAERKYWHTVVGYNYRMTNMQAAIGLAQIERAEQFRSERKKMFEMYSAALQSIPELRLPAAGTADEEPVYWMYTVELKDETERNALAIHLGETGIETRPVFPALTLMPIYEEYVQGQLFPVAEGISARGLNLPSSSDLTQEEISYIAAAIKDFFQKQVKV